jgi:hypothetical protein
MQLLQIRLEKLHCNQRLSFMTADKALIFFLPERTIKVIFQTLYEQEPLFYTFASLMLAKMAKANQ